MSFRAAKDVIFSDTTVDTSTNSESVDLLSLYGISFQFNWTNGSTPDIDLDLQVSNDAINWVTLTSPTTTTISTASGSAIISLSDVFYRYARINITVNSGSADLDIIYNGKGI